MRRILAVLGVVAAIPVVLFLVWDTQTRTLGNTLTADLSAAKKQSFKREPPARSPVHDNGFQCVGAMLDVSPGDFGPFSPKKVSALDPFITGQKPIADLPPEVRNGMLAFSPWAAAVRGCGDSMQLTWVDGISPWARSTQPRSSKLTEAIPALIEFTALELRVLLADGQPEVALERCGSTWAVVADQSHLGQVGAMNARMAVRRLAPVCAEALIGRPAEVKKQLAKQWTPLKSRLAPPKEVMEAERLGISTSTFAWVSDEAIRSQLPGVVVPVGKDFMSRVHMARTWREWDGAMRALVAVADVPGAERVSAAGRVDAIFPSQYEKFLSAYEETGVLLELLVELAVDGSKPLPPGVNKSEKGLEFTSPQAQPLLIPTSK